MKVLQTRLSAVPRYCQHSSQLPAESVLQADRSEITLAFTGAAVLFLPLFVFLPKILQQAMKADADAAIEAFGKNEQVKRVFWTLFVVMAGLVLTRVVDPVTAQQVVGVISSALL